MRARRAVRIAAFAIVALGLIGRAALAQEWPSRAVRLIVPFPPGGGADAIARIVSGRLAEMWGQQLVIENRGGAGGNIAAEAAARAPPDGYTLFMAGDFQATNIHLYPKLSYDPVADFAPVSLVVKFPVAFVVPNSSPATSVQAFIAHANASGGKLTFASPASTSRTCPIAAPPRRCRISCRAGSIPSSTTLPAWCR